MCGKWCCGNFIQQRSYFCFASQFIFSLKSYQKNEAKFNLMKHLVFSRFYPLFIFQLVTVLPLETSAHFVTEPHVLVNQALQLEFFLSKRNWIQLPILLTLKSNGMCQILVSQIFFRKIFLKLHDGCKKG